MTEIPFPLRTVRIFEDGPSPEDCERQQIMLCRAYLRKARQERTLIEMREMREMGIPIAEIARQFGCSRHSVYAWTNR